MTARPASRAAELIERLGLAPHPEGGWYRELFRSADQVTRADGAARAALTSIHFLLVAGAHSRWHRVDADESWHHAEGAPLELSCIAPTLDRVDVVRLGPAGDGATPAFVVPAGWWQCARPTGDYALVGCTVGPGFDFADFALLDDRPAEARVLRERFAEVRALG